MVMVMVVVLMMAIASVQGRFIRASSTPGDTNFYDQYEISPTPHHQQRKHHTQRTGTVELEFFMEGIE